MDELQLELFSQDKTPREAKDKPKQFRVSPEEDREIVLTCRWINLSYSVISRIMWRILSRRRQEMPQIKDDPVKMIDKAADEFFTYLPIYIKQKQIAPRIF